MGKISRKAVRLGDVADIITGFPFDGNAYSTKGIRVIRGENVTIGNLRWDICKCWDSFSPVLGKYMLQAGDIVVGMDGSRVGKNRARIESYDLPLLLAQRVACIRHNEKSDQSYIYYCIFSDMFEKYVQAIHTGTSIPHISASQLANYTFLMPDSLLEQRKIGTFLSSLDDKIELNARINQNLEKMAA